MPTRKPIWTRIITEKLKKKGQENGYDTSRSGRYMPVDENSS
jgi:hypothetical protein